MRTSLPASIAALACLLAAAGCETKKSSNPLSPTVAGPIGGVTITAPKNIEPANGATIAPGTPVDLLIENATSNGERPIWQELEVALDSGFSQRVHVNDRLAPGPNGRTSYRIPVALDPGKGYFWRVRALDGANTGPFSSASLFQVQVAVRIETPVPVSPIRRDMIAGTRPTLVVQNTAVVGTTAPVAYRFEVAADTGFTQMLAVWSVPRSGGETTQVTGSDLAPGTEYYWRVIASDGGYASPYSIIQAFRTEASAAPAPDPSPSPSPSPGPAPGGGGPWPRNGEEVIAWAARNYPDRLAPVGSLDQRKHNMEFLRDRMIEAGLCGGMQLGWNMKRGGPEVSIDFLTELVNGRWHGIDIARDYDNHRSHMTLTWSDTGPDNYIFHRAYPGGLPCR